MKTDKLTANSEEEAPYLVAVSGEEQETIRKALAILTTRLSRAGAVSFNGGTDTKKYLTLKYVEQRSESFGVLFLDNRHRLIAEEVLFHGTLNGTAVYPREILVRALHHNAAAVILFHNHPSGVGEPSRADEILTARLKEALTLIDVRVLDHIIVAIDGAVSFSERGLL